MSPDTLTPTTALFSVASADIAHIAVVMGSGDAGALNLARVQMTDAVAAEFRSVVNNCSWWSPNDYQLRVYDPGYKPDARDVIYAAVDDVAGINQLIQLLTSPGNLPQFEADDESIESLRLYAIVGGTKKDRTMWLRSYTARRELSRSALFAMIQRKGGFDVVKHNVLTFDQRIDCIVRDQFVFVRDVGSFERLFGLVEQVKAAAQQSIQKLTTIASLANAGDFVQVCSASVQMAAKAVQIATRPYVSSITMDDIKKTIAKHDLPIKLNAAGRLIFDKSPKTRWLILKVLDDAYLDSTMTGLSYETNSKAPISSGD